MELTKNRDYFLRHVDPASGFGLLFSLRNDRCIFLNPLGTLLWQDKGEVISESIAYKKLDGNGRIAGAAKYITGIIEDMRRAGVLLPPDGVSSAYDPGAGPKPERKYELGQIYFYVTKECNARCYHCYQPTITVESEPRAPRSSQITKQAFLSLVESAIPLGLKSVKITGGEPLLRSDLIEIIGGIGRLGLHVSMETNGSLINERLADQLADLNVEVSISLDAGSAVIHDALRRLPGCFERVTRALRMLAERKCDPKVIMAVSKRNLGEVENVVRVATANGCRLIKLNPVNTLGLAKQLGRTRILLTVEEIIALNNDRRRLESQYGAFLFLEGPPAFASIDEIVNGHVGICPFTGILGVLSDGSLSFCGVGNSCPELVFSKVDEPNFNLEKIWQKAAALIEVRRQLTRRLEGICGSCVLESFCKGSCRALAYCESGSFLSPHPWCQRAFTEGLFPAYYMRNSTQGGEKYGE